MVAQDAENTRQGNRIEPHKANTVENAKYLEEIT